ncbi:MAG: hypothetical protein E7553_02610 [Ruminococcaceae bacterium]|nr:hypothetical protein [Oscillospiraceae bacterium]
MNCQHCQKRPATTHIKCTVNGKKSEMYVCAECAAKHGIEVFGGTAGIGVENLFGGLFAAPSLRDPDEHERCRFCRKSFREIVQSGVVGCPECYIQFYDRLQPSIQRVHGKTTHVGKIAASGSPQMRKKREIAALKEELTKALASQDYERCAVLRDQIKELEGEGND